MLAGLKLAKKKKSYCEIPLGADFRFRSCVFLKTGVLKSFAKITGKQLRHCLFLIKLQATANFYRRLLQQLDRSFICI